ncbi:MAG: hypothetical protein IPM39_27955 [Chloroflexi bacterium]|nr:hypothetical protein [Chloroflexota bacterium]
MLDFDLELNIDQELSEIPPEFQDAFRQAMAREMADTEQNRTDTDILHYLRQRRDDFKRGGFIRPDGRPGMVTLNPETMYEQALPQLAQSSLGEPDNTAERRRTLVKIAVFVGVALLFVFFVFRGRTQREAAQTVTAAAAPATAAGANGTATPAMPLPEITGVEDSLQTIGSLGGALTIGRPSAIEITYSRTAETIALPIDPSKPTPKGEMRYNAATMLSDNPVAVWLFGAVLNYAIGIPDSLVRNLAPGDRIVLSTDTGASLRFVVAETWQGANYEAGRLLSQNRLGLTLFALPAGAEDDVSFAFANYDITSEEGQEQRTYELEEQISLPGGGSLRVTTVQFNHETSGDIRIAVEGKSESIPASQSLMLTLAAQNGQTTAVPLTPDESGNWQASFTLPDEISGLPLLAEVRALPAGSLAVVGLGETPHLWKQLEIGISGTWWDEAQRQVVLTAVITHTGIGDVYPGPDFIQISHEGGDAYETNGQATSSLPGQRLPTLIHPGETVDLTVTFLPQAPSVRVQIGADLWEITGIPTGMSSHP